MAGGGVFFPGSLPFLGQTLTFWEANDQGKDCLWNIMKAGVGWRTRQHAFPFSAPLFGKGAASDLSELSSKAEAATQNFLFSCLPPTPKPVGK